jgi:Na+-driven multidrug efflux pump
MSTLYGTLAVGALGISNNIGGLSTNPQSGFQDGGASIISQNIGAKNYKRSLEAFYRLLIINIAIGFLGYLLTMIFLPQISSVFAKDNQVFQKLISDVYFYEAIGAVPLGITAAIMALLYGYGYTKLTLVINFARVFVFRIPVLYYLQNFTQMGSRSVGIVMMVSNVATGAMSILAGYYVIKEVKKKHKKA